MPDYPFPVARLTRFPGRYTVGQTVRAAAGFGYAEAEIKEIITCAPDYQDDKFVIAYSEHGAGYNKPNETVSASTFFGLAPVSWLTPEEYTRYRTLMTTPASAMPMPLRNYVSHALNSTFNSSLKAENLIAAWVVGPADFAQETAMYNQLQTRRGLQPVRS